MMIQINISKQISIVTLIICSDKETVVNVTTASDDWKIQMRFI